MIVSIFSNLLRINRVPFVKKILNFGFINIESVYEVPEFVTCRETNSSYTLEIFGY